MKLTESEAINFESIIIRKNELIRLLTDSNANDYESADEETVKGWFISLVNTLVTFSFEEYRMRKEISKKYNLPYSFIYKEGQVFTEATCPFKETNSLKG